MATDTVSSGHVAAAATDQTGSWNPALRPEGGSSPPSSLPSIDSEEISTRHQSQPPSTTSSLEPDTATRLEPQSISSNTQPSETADDLPSIDSAPEAAISSQNAGDSQVLSEEVSNESAPVDNNMVFSAAQNVLPVREETSFEQSNVLQQGDKSKGASVAFTEETVEHSLPWADEEEGSAPLSAQDPLQRADLLGRTNSFPVMQGSGRDGGQGYMDNNVATNGDIDESLNHITQPWSGGFEEHDDGMEDDFFQQLKTQTKPIYDVPPEAESRFEEGIPLVEDEAHEEPVEEKKDTAAQIESLFEQDEAPEESEFFSSVKAEDPLQDSSKPPPFNRKSTSQVLGSLQFDENAGDDESPHGLTSSHEKGNETKSLEDQANGGEAVSEEDLAEKWKALLDDDDLLMEDEEDMELLPDDTQPSSASFDQTQNDRGRGSTARPLHEDGNQPSTPYSGPPQNAFDSPQGRFNPYAPHQPTSSDLVQGLPTTGYGMVPPPGTPGSTHHSQSPATSAHRAESFSNQAKGGYKSPYDLPMDLSRPRKNAPAQRVAPPPVASLPTPPSSNSLTGIQPSTPSLAPPSTTIAPLMTPFQEPERSVPPAANPPANKNNFYEDLPVAPRSRNPSRARYAPVGNTSSAVPPLQPSNQNLPTSRPSSQHANDPNPQFQLQHPGQAEPYTNLPVPSAPVASGAPASRYSPNPSSLQPGSKPATSPRYSPAPPPPADPTGTSRNKYVSQPAVVPAPANTLPNPPPNPLPFQPRTSSPLAQHEKHAYQGHTSENGVEHNPPIGISPQPAQPHHQAVESPSRQADGYFPDAGGSHNRYTPSARKPSATGYFPPQMSPPQNIQASTSKFPGHGQNTMTQSHAYSPATDTQLAPPRRSQTQSPGKVISHPSLPMTGTESFQRPASAHGPNDQTNVSNPYGSNNQGSGFSQLNFIEPTDGQEQDFLQRWRGAPILQFGFGGTVSACFPKYIPRYTSGSLAPMMKPSPGETNIRHMDGLLPPVDSICKSPGPLRSKSKKKDVIAWLSSKIASFENEGPSESSRLHPEPHKRHDEKILLWKIIRALVEHDGTLEANPEAQKALRNIISPWLDNPESETQTYGAGVQSAWATLPTSTNIQAETADPRALGDLCNNLLSGDREKAVWSAVDNRLWGHAMLISSTMDKQVWKQVVQEFVGREVRAKGNNTESLAALYEIFAGNLEESVDELVPPSARAGLQMVSKVDGSGPAKNALGGLDRWRETLGLIMSNRSLDDQQALGALGRLLSSYGRVEASHICHLFSRSAPTSQVFGGADDPQASIVLLGADHRAYPSTFALDEDAVILTEVYEFATSVLPASSSQAVLPHFQAYKLHHASSLADKGYKTEAQQYCEAVASVLKATTRPSPYYHHRLFAEVDELTNRLRQAPTDGSSSWIPKPSMEKVSGSMWAKFNSFVAGDDSDAASTGSGGKGGEADIGPFAKVAGTPTISPSASGTDLYGSHISQQTQPVPATATASRYTPSSQYAAHGSPEQLRGRQSLDSQRSASYGSPSLTNAQRSRSHDAAMGDGNPYQPNPYVLSTSATAQHSTPPQTSHVPLPPVVENSSNQDQPDLQTQASPPKQQLGFGGYQADGVPSPSVQNPAPTSQLTSGFGLLNAGNGYNPTGSTYEPPSYESNLPKDEDSPVEEDQAKPKIKSIMDDDDDDDITSRAAALKESEKAKADRETAERFKQAAEEDGMSTSYFSFPIHTNQSFFISTKI